MTEKAGQSQKSPTMRIAKWVAYCGVASRRQAEQLIAEGKIKCNGHVVTHPSLKVGEGDHVTYNGKLLRRSQTLRLWRYYKPCGLLVTNHDPQNRPTIYQTFPKTMPRVVSVGRLDINSEGLLLLTNNGSVARYLERPNEAFVRSYRVRVYGNVNMRKLKSLKDGCFYKNVRYGPMHVSIEKTLEENAKNNWLKISLSEGKNREIRNVMAFCGLRVNRLIRITYGDFSIEGLKKGQIQEIPSSVIEQSFRGKVPQKMIL